MKISRELTQQERIKVALIEKARRTDKVHAAKDVLVRGRGVKDLAEDDDTAYLFSGTGPIVESTVVEEKTAAEVEAAAGDEWTSWARQDYEEKRRSTTDANMDLSGLRLFFRNVQNQHREQGLLSEQDVDLLIKLADVPPDISEGLRHLVEVIKRPFECAVHETLDWGCQRCVAAEILKGDYDMKYLIVPAEEGTQASPDNAENIDGHEVSERVQQLNDDTGYEAVGLFVKVARWKRKLSRE